MSLLEAAAYAVNPVSAALMDRAGGDANKPRATLRERAFAKSDRHWKPLLDRAAAATKPSTQKAALAEPAAESSGPSPLLLLGAAALLFFVVRR